MIDCRLTETEESETVDMGGLSQLFQFCKLFYSIGHDPLYGSVTALQDCF